MSASDYTTMLKASALQKGAIGTAGKSNNVFAAKKFKADYLSDAIPASSALTLEVDYNNSDGNAEGGIFYSFSANPSINTLTLTFKNFICPNYSVILVSYTFDFESDGSTLSIRNSEEPFFADGGEFYYILINSTNINDDTIVLNTNSKLTGQFYVLMIDDC